MFIWTCVYLDPSRFFCCWAVCIVQTSSSLIWHSEPQCSQWGLQLVEFWLEPYNAQHLFSKYIPKNGPTPIFPGDSRLWGFVTSCMSNRFNSRGKTIDSVCMLFVLNWFVPLSNSRLLFIFISIALNITCTTNERISLKCYTCMYVDSENLGVGGVVVKRCCK